MKSSTASVLHNLGYVALNRGDRRQAHEFFRQALSLFQSLGDRRGLAECVVGLAGVVATEQPERAARLFGAAEWLFETMGAQLSPTNQPDYEQYLAVARDRIDTQAFASAWEEGRAMTLKQAMAYATEGDADS